MNHLFTPFLPLFSINSRRSTVTLVLLVTILLCSTAIAAEEQAVDEGEMSEIVVTATRYEEGVNLIPANVTIINKEDITNSTAQNIPDLLRGQAGVKVNDITGNRRTYTVDLRGFGETAGSNTLVLIDGRKVTQADLSGTDWAQIPLDRVERIEVIRGGSGGVLYGDNASGGVINIITSQGDEFASKVEGTAGSYETYKVNTSASGKTGDLSYSASVDTLKSDGYRENSDTKMIDIGFSFDYYIMDKARLDFSSGIHNDRTGLPGALTESDLDAGTDRRESVHKDDFSEIDDYYYKGGAEVYFGEASSFKISASHRKRESSFFSSFFGGTFTGDTEIRTNSVSPQIILRNQFGNLKNILTAGYDYQEDRETIVNEIIFGGFPSKDTFRFKKQGQGYYVHDIVSPVKSLSFSVGYRSDKADYDFKSSTAEDLSVDEDSYTAGINYTYYKKSYVYVSYAKSFRYPLLDEFFSFSTNTVNTELDNQTSDDYEFGFRHYFTESSYAQVNLFRIDTEDEIFFNPILFSNENLDGETRRDGLEISFNANPAQWLNVNGSYTYVNAKIRDGQFKDKRIPDVPDHKATLGTTLFWKRASLALNGYYVGERPFISDYNNDFSDQDDYVVINTRLKYKWRKFTAFFDINNLTDEEYSEYGVLSLFSVPTEKAFYPSPERHYLFGVSYDL